MITLRKIQDNINEPYVKLKEHMERKSADGKGRPSTYGLLNYLVKGTDSSKITYCTKQMVDNYRKMVEMEFVDDRLQASLSDFQMSQKEIEKFVYDNYLGIYVHGVNRVGKTHFCKALANEYIKLGIAGVEIIEIHTALQQYKKSGFQDTTLLKRMESVAVLILDDVSAERLSEWDISILKPIFDVRLNKVTILNGNVSRAKLADILGVTIVSRLLHNKELELGDGKNNKT